MTREKVESCKRLEVAVRPFREGESGYPKYS